MTTDDPIIMQRHDLEHCLPILTRTLVYYEPSLATLSREDLRDYATRRLLRDHYLKYPKTLAADLHRYVADYPIWWEEWRVRGMT